MQKNVACNMWIRKRSFFSKPFVHLIVRYLYNDSNCSCGEMINNILLLFKLNELQNPPEIHNIFDGCGATFFIFANGKVFDFTDE